MPGDDYTRSRSRKQWTDRTEGVLKNIIDKLWESTTIPSTLINIPDWVPQGFLLTVNINEFDLVKDIAQTLTVWLTAVSIGSWAGTVNLTNSHDLCSGGSVSLENSSLVLDSENLTRGTRVTISIPSNCPAGSYHVTLTGTGDSLKREVVITIHVGVAGLPPEGDKCKADQDCIDKYGSGYRCVDGQCLKICGIAEQSNCNDDDCPSGQKCVWDATKLACFCKDKDFQLICQSSLTLYRGMSGKAQGTLSLISRNGFASSVSITVRDLCQPECMKCAYPVLKYGSQSGNIVVVPLGAGETKDITLEVTATGGGCPTLTTYHLEIEAWGGGKNHRCIVNVEIKSQTGGGMGVGRFGSGYSNIAFHVEYFLDSGRTQKFLEHTYITGYQTAPTWYMSDCFMFSIPGNFWWTATWEGYAGVCFSFHCVDGYQPDWCVSYGTPSSPWNSQCICAPNPCGNPTQQCTGNGCVCPEE